MRPRILLWLALLCWSWLPMTGGAETRALLIGASVSAPGLGIADLKGPPNDIRLLKATLQARGVRDIRLLADQVVGAKRPTHAAILQAFADLATASRPGDLVFIALSGHGTQQPDQNGDESDGLDEVFCPPTPAGPRLGRGRSRRRWSMTRSARRCWR